MDISELTVDGTPSPIKRKKKPTPLFTSPNSGFDLGSPKEVELSTSLSNLKWGFKRREEGLLEQLAVHKEALNELYKLHVNLKDKLNAAGTTTCVHLEAMEGVVEMQEEHEQQHQEQLRYFRTLQNKLAVLEADKVKLEASNTALQSQLLLLQSQHSDIDPTSGSHAASITRTDAELRRSTSKASLSSEDSGASGQASGHSTSISSAVQEAYLTVPVRTASAPHTAYNDTINTNNSDTSINSGSGAAANTASASTSHAVNTTAEAPPDTPSKLSAKERLRARLNKNKDTTDSTADTVTSHTSDGATNSNPTTSNTNSTVHTADVISAGMSTPTRAKHTTNRRHSAESALPPHTVLDSTATANSSNTGTSDSTTTTNHIITTNNTTNNTSSRRNSYPRKSAVPRQHHTSNSPVKRSAKSGFNSLSSPSKIGINANKSPRTPNRVVGSDTTNTDTSATTTTNTTPGKSNSPRVSLRRRIELHQQQQQLQSPATMDHSNNAWLGAFSTAGRTSSGGMQFYVDIVEPKSRRHSSVVGGDGVGTGEGSGSGIGVGDGTSDTSGTSNNNMNNVGNHHSNSNEMYVVHHTAEDCAVSSGDSLQEALLGMEGRDLAELNTSNSVDHGDIYSVVGDVNSVGVGNTVVASDVGVGSSGAVYKQLTLQSPTHSAYNLHNTNTSLHTNNTDTNTTHTTTTNNTTAITTHSSDALTEVHALQAELDTVEEEVSALYSPLAEVVHTRGAAHAVGVVTSSVVVVGGDVVSISSGSSDTVESSGDSSTSAVTAVDDSAVPMTTTTDTMLPSTTDASNTSTTIDTAVTTTATAITTTHTSINTTTTDTTDKLVVDTTSPLPTPHITDNNTPIHTPSHTPQTPYTPQHDSHANSPNKFIMSELQSYKRQVQALKTQLAAVTSEIKPTASVVVSVGVQCSEGSLFVVDISPHDNSAGTGSGDSSNVIGSVGSGMDSSGSKSSVAKSNGMSKNTAKTADVITTSDTAAVNTTTVDMVTTTNSAETVAPVTVRTLFELAADTPVKTSAVVSGASSVSGSDIVGSRDSGVDSGVGDVVYSGSIVDIAALPIAVSTTNNSTSASGDSTNIANATTNNNITTSTSSAGVVGYEHSEIDDMCVLVDAAVQCAVVCVDCGTSTDVCTVECGSGGDGSVVSVVKVLCNTGVQCDAVDTVVRVSPVTVVSGSSSGNAHSNSDINTTITPQDTTHNKSNTAHNATTTTTTTTTTNTRDEQLLRGIEDSKFQLGRKLVELKFADMQSSTKSSKGSGKSSGASGKSSRGKSKRSGVSDATVTSAVLSTVPPSVVGTASAATNVVTTNNTMNTTPTIATTPTINTAALISEHAQQLQQNAELIARLLSKQAQQRRDQCKIDLLQRKLCRLVMFVKSSGGVGGVGSSSGSVNPTKTTSIIDTGNTDNTSADSAPPHGHMHQSESLRVGDMTLGADLSQLLCLDTSSSTSSSASPSVCGEEEGSTELLQQSMQVQAPIPQSVQGRRSHQHRRVDPATELLDGPTDLFSPRRDFQGRRYDDLSELNITVHSNPLLHNNSSDSVDIDSVNNTNNSVNYTTESHAHNINHSTEHTPHNTIHTTTSDDYDAVPVLDVDSVLDISFGPRSAFDVPRMQSLSNNKNDVFSPIQKTNRTVSGANSNIVNDTTTSSVKVSNSNNTSANISTIASPTTSSGSNYNLNSLFARNPLLSRTSSLGRLRSPSQNTVVERVHTSTVHTESTTVPAVRTPRTLQTSRTVPVDVVVDTVHESDSSTPLYTASGGAGGSGGASFVNPMRQKRLAKTTNTTVSTTTSTTTPSISSGPVTTTAAVVNTTDTLVTDTITTHTNNNIDTTTTTTIDSPTKLSSSSLHLSVRSISALQASAYSSPDKRSAVESSSAVDSAVQDYAPPASTLHHSTALGHSTLQSEDLHRQLLLAQSRLGKLQQHSDYLEARNKNLQREKELLVTKLTHTVHNDAAASHGIKVYTQNEEYCLDIPSTTTSILLGFLHSNNALLDKIGALTDNLEDKMRQLDKQKTVEADISNDLTQALSQNHHLSAEVSNLMSVNRNLSSDNEGYQRQVSQLSGTLVHLAQENKMLKERMKMYSF